MSDNVDKIIVKVIMELLGTENKEYVLLEMKNLIEDRAYLRGKCDAFLSRSMINDKKDN